VSGFIFANKPLPSGSPSVHFYPFAGGAVLHRRETRRIWALNATSACIWCLLDESRTAEELAENLARTFRIDQAAARRDVAATLSTFAVEGLLAGGTAAPCREEDGPARKAGAAPPLTEPALWAVRRYFSTARHSVEFCCSDPSVGAEFSAHLAHLAIDRPPTIDTRLAVLGDHRWEIYLDGRRVAVAAARNMVLPFLFTLLFVRGSNALHDKLLFHAAVIGSADRAVLFPADAGCGKTTLAAALAARGHLFLADELAVLDRSDLTLTPLPLPMSIKPGSVGVLERYYAGIAEKPVHLREDGQRVRYLEPPAVSVPAAGFTGAAVEALVFPRYRPGAAPRLAELEKIDALQRLAATGSSDRELVAADVEAMIRVVDGRPCFELEYSDLAATVEGLENSFASFDRRSRQ
jgi:hypothetical protein